MKKTMFFLLWLLGGVGWLMISGCKEKNASGQILEFGTDKPVANATLTLRECEGEVLGNFTCTDVATTKSDTDGNFAFDRDGTVVSGEATGYWDSGDDFAFINRDGGPLPVTLHLYPHAWLRVTIKNESGAYGFYKQSNVSGIPPIVLAQGQDSIVHELLIKGNVLNRYIFTIEQTPDGGTPNNIYWEMVKVLKNGESAELQKALGGVYVNYLPAGHDTTELTIHY